MEKFNAFENIIHLIIVISADRRPMMDIGLPKCRCGEERRTIPCFSHPAGYCDFHQVMGPPCRGPTHTTPSGTRPQL